MITQAILDVHDPTKSWHPNKIDSPYEKDLLPYIDYLNEDIEYLPSARSANYIDNDDDFRIGLSGGFVFNNDFIFVHTEKFSEVAEHYNTNKSYTSLKFNSDEYVEFWKRETTRRRNGLSLNCKLYKKDLYKYLSASTQEEANKYLHPVRITGDHYNYLNYGRIMRTKTAEEQAESNAIGDFIETTTGFPRFWDGDYINYKVDEFVERNHYHLCKAKARSKGYSFKESANIANLANRIRDIRIILCAYKSDKYLTCDGALTSMTKTNLNWYESKTEYERGYYKEDINDLILGYKSSKGGHVNEGWGSAIQSVSLFGSPDAAVGGKRPLRIIVEEAGICPNLGEMLDVTASSVEVGTTRIGVIKVFGTGGTKEANWEPFKKVFYNPTSRHMLPMENVWDDGARNNVCGFFHPQVLNLEPYMDQWGNSLVIKAYHFDVQDKINVSKNPETTAEQFSVYCGQRANKPAEAFGNVKENLFTSKELTTHYKNLIAVPDTDFVDGMYIEKSDGTSEFMSNEEIKKLGMTIHPFINEYPYNGKDRHGCIRRYHSPYLASGKVPTDLYDTVFDPIGKNVDDKELTNKHSLDCIITCAYPNLRYPISDRICEVYIGRRDSDETAKILAATVDSWNCKVLGEVDRGTMIKDMKRLNKIHKLHRDPTNILNGKKQQVNAPYGINIGGGHGDKVTEAYIELQKWLYLSIGVTEDDVTRRVFHTIKDMGILCELTKFSINSGNYDRLSALRLWTILRNVYQIQKKDQSRKPINTLPQKTLIGSLNLR